MYSLVIKPLAEADILYVVKWYNKIFDGLGDEFLLALEAKLSLIQRNPKHAQIVYKRIRRTLTERFPYAVFYIMEEHTIYILAVIHTSRNPKIWKGRN